MHLMTASKAYLLFSMRYKNRPMAGLLSVSQMRMAPPHRRTEKAPMDWKEASSDWGLAPPCWRTEEAPMHKKEASSDWRWAPARRPHRKWRRELSWRVSPKR